MVQGCVYFSWEERERRIIINSVNHNEHYLWIFSDSFNLPSWMFFVSSLVFWKVKNLRISSRTIWIRCISVLCFLKNTTKRHKLYFFCLSLLKQHKYNREKNISFQSQRKIIWHLETAAKKKNSTQKWRRSAYDVNWNDFFTCFSFQFSVFSFNVSIFHEISNFSLWTNSWMIWVAWIGSRLSKDTQIRLIKSNLTTKSCKTR